MAQKQKTWWRNPKHNDEEEFWDSCSHSSGFLDHLEVVKITALGCKIYEKGVLAIIRFFLEHGRVVRELTLSLEPPYIWSSPLKSFTRNIRKAYPFLDFSVKRIAADGVSISAAHR
ncbi:hypothetical protein REPUB_Repub09cG0086100 [Reevesia pubescens]